MHTTYTFENPINHGRLTRYAKILLLIWLSNGMLTKKEILRKMFPQREIGRGYYSSLFGEMSRSGLISYDRKDWTIKLTTDGVSYVIDDIVVPCKNVLFN